MALDLLNSSNLEQLGFKGLITKFLLCCVYTRSWRDLKADERQVRVA